MALNRILRVLYSDDDSDDELPRKIRKLRDTTLPFDGLSDFQIYERYRFTPAAILNLTNLLKNDLERSTNRNHSILPLECICLALRYLASNAFQQVIGDTLNVDKSTQCRSLWSTINALMKHSWSFIKFPTYNQRRDIHEKFQEKNGFPFVIGLIDGTHVQILPPKRIEHVYFNRKHRKTYNVQAVCGPNGEFFNINVSFPGSAHVTRVFRESRLKSHLDGQPLDFGYLLGDSGYPCSDIILTPYLKPNNNQQHRYNSSHKRTRVLIEQVFGRWKRRFHILHGEIRVFFKNVPKLVLCCAILHNYAVHLNLPDFEDEVENDDIDDNNDLPNNFDNNTRRRDYICQHFF